MIHVHDCLLRIGELRFNSKPPSEAVLIRRLIKLKNNSAKRRATQRLHRHRARGMCANPREVAPGIGLGEADRSDRLACDHARKPILFLFVSAEMRQKWRDDVSVHILGRRRQVKSAEFFQDDCLELEIATGSAEFF